MMRIKTWLRRRRGAWIAFGLYCIAAIIMTWPIAGQLTSHLPGPGDDLLVHYWNGWRFKQILQQGGELYRTNLIFHPAGVSLLYHNLSWVNIALWLPLEPLAGGIAAFNLIYLLNLALCGLGMYILARYLTHSPGAAFIAGLIYAFWPYRIFEIDHPNLITTQWLPLFLLHVICVVREKEKFKHALLAAFFLILTGYTRWQLLVFAFIIAALYGLYSLWAERARWNKRVVLALALAVLVSAIVMAPPIYPMLKGQLTRDHPEDLFVESLVPKQTDLLAYIVPPHNHLLGGLFRGLTYAKDFDRAWYSNAYLGVAALLLSVLGISKARKAAWFWGGLALVSWLLALGPALRFNKEIYSNIPLPYALAEKFVLIRAMRTSRRFNMLLALPVAALAGYGASALLDHLRERLERRGKERRPSILLLVCLVFIIGLDYAQIPVQSFEVSISPFHYALAQDPEPFALLNLPTGRTRSPYYMLCQTVHGKPIVEGSVARPPREAKAFIDDNPFLAYLRDNRKFNPDFPDISRQLTVLAEADVRYIVINKWYAFPWEKENWRTYLAYRPLYEDELIEVYRTTPQAGRDFELRHKMGKGIGLTRVLSTTDYIGPLTQMEVALVWGTIAPQSEDLAAELALVDADGQPQQSVRFPPSGIEGWPTSEWPADTLTHWRYTFRIDPRLPSGFYTLTLTLVDRNTGERVGEPVTLKDRLEMALPPRVFTPPPLQTEVNADFGDALRLLGYDLARENGALNVTLHWRALRRMDEGYKFFLHLYGSEDNEPLAQTDVVPRDWTYPTNWWEADEVVSDEIRLPLDGVAPGTYRLAVGAYDSGTRERLPIHQAEGEPRLEEKKGALIIRPVTLP